jgi:hypothetical protein
LPHGRDDNRDGEGYLRFLLETIVIGALGGICLLIFIGVVTAQWSDPNAVARRRLQKTAATAIGEISQDGLFKIVGTVRYCAPPIIAPLTKRTCACYIAGVESTYVGSRSHSGLEIASEKKTTDFLVEDESGSVRVRTEDAVMLLSSDAAPADEEQATEIDNAIVEFLKSKGAAVIPPVNEIIYREGIVEEGEEVVVLAHISRVPVTRAGAMARSGYRDTPTELVARGSTQTPMVIDDFQRRRPRASVAAED